tara:strand:- start:562 stop:1503 length:942 start_codon:yes stop_codon:yes gene_type:complete
MTNMSKKELKRIVDQKLSPLYISVHATDVDLRRRLLLYKWGKDDFLLKKVKYLIDNGIELHGQIVLIPNMNDGKHLKKTASDIYEFFPKFKTLSIVPVGLTRHRDGLPELNYVNNNYAKKLFDEYPSLNKQFPGKKSPFLLLSDEWYILANKPFPPKEYYGEYDLIENGVGQFRDFIDRFKEESLNFPKQINKPAKISIVTSTLVYDIFTNLVKPVLEKIKNLEVNFYKIENNFFGDSVTVAGLLTGKDIISQLEGYDLGNSVWTTYRILNEDQTLTLDDMTLDQISKKLDTKFRVSKNDSIKEIIDYLENEA